MPFSSFAQPHASTLRAIFDEPDWREVVADGTLDAARRDILAPPKTANVFALPVAQLVAINEGKVRRLIASGERDEDRLLAALGTWPSEWPESVPVRLAFLGVSLSLRCNMQPRCIYCNQRAVEQRMTLDDWKALMRSLVPENGEGTYVYVTGGEPLLFGEGLWGPDGLVRVAADAGAACNLNTNALGLTPRAAIGLVRAGLGRIHISLDSHRPEVEDAIHQRSGRWRQIVRGLCNLQVAKAVLGAQHPLIHINCVLTRLNASDFPAFLRFVLGMKPLVEGGVGQDLDMHLIPVGGHQNRDLRLSPEDYVRLFTESWEQADAVWQEYLAERDVPADKRLPLHRQQPFMSPFHRVQQRGDVEEWARHAAEGLPAALSLTQRCYVAPTQGFVLPDGAQYWCGGHTVSRPEPLGSVLTHSLRENIRRSLHEMASLPADQCSTCAGATQAINQIVEAQLKGKIAEWLKPDEQTPSEHPTPDERAFE
ncbi:MAG: radical SAM protein [Armatimonadota bacterium]